MSKELGLKDGILKAMIAKQAKEIEELKATMREMQSTIDDLNEENKNT